MSRVDAITSALVATYGHSPMTSDLAKHLDDKWDEFVVEGDNRDELYIAIWMWFPGGGTAEIAAERVRKAVGEASG